MPRPIPLPTHYSDGEHRRSLVRDAGLAEVLNVSRAQIHVLKRRGMPSISVGGARRYDVDECINWLRENGAADG